MKRTNRRKKIAFIKTCCLPFYVDLSTKEGRDKLVNMFANRYSSIGLYNAFLKV